MNIGTYDLEISSIFSNVASRIKENSVGLNRINFIYFIKFDMML